MEDRCFLHDGRSSFLSLATSTDTYRSPYGGYESHHARGEAAAVSAVVKIASLKIASLLALLPPTWSLYRRTRDGVCCLPWPVASAAASKVRSRLIINEKNALYKKEVSKPAPQLPAATSELQWSSALS